MVTLAADQSVSITALADLKTTTEAAAAEVVVVASVAVAVVVTEVAVGLVIVEAVVVEVVSAAVVEEVIEVVVLPVVVEDSPPTVAASATFLAPRSPSTKLTTVSILRTTRRMHLHNGKPRTITCY